MKDAHRLRLDVRVSGIAVGQLERDREGRVRFGLDPDWLERGQLPRLGLGFLRDPSPRVAGTGLPAWFEGLLPPPDSALRVRVCRAWGLRDTDSASLLRALGRDLPGAVEVTGQVEPAESVAQVAPERLTLGFSLAGMQLKFSMTARGERFAVPGRDQDGSWIVKVPSPDLAELPQVEHATMSWARAVGLRVPDHRIVDPTLVDNLPADVLTGVRAVFAVQRFDRRPGHPRVHQEDFAQALEIHPTHLYGDTGPHRTSADLLGRLVLDTCGLEAAHDYVDRLAFVVASGNGDAHLKNHSLQWEGRALRPTLSPVYDQVSTIAWPRFGWGQPAGPRLALAVGRTRAFAKLDRGHVDTFAARSHIPDAAPRFIDALARVRDAYRLVEPLTPAVMADALRDHWTRTPVLRAVGRLTG